MKTALFLFSLLLSISYVQAQEIAYLNLDSLAEAQAKNIIIDRETDYAIIYESGCLGCAFLREVDCGCEDNGTDTHLIWEEEQRYFTKEIGCCEPAEVAEFSGSTLFKEIISNKSKIFSSEFKTEYEEMHHGFNKLVLHKF